MNRSPLAMLALFLSGLFAGGVLDHGLLAMQGSAITSYNIHVGVMGNWGFMMMDGVIALGLFLLHRRWIKEVQWRQSPPGLPALLHERRRDGVQGGVATAPPPLGWGGVGVG